MVERYAIVGFWSVVAAFVFLLIKHPRFFIKRPSYIGFHTLSLGVFIIYMYESGEYTNDDIHRYAKKIGVHVTNRQVGISILMLILLYTVMKTYSVVKDGI